MKLRSILAASLMGNLGFIAYIAYSRPVPPRPAATNRPSVGTDRKLASAPVQAARESTRSEFLRRLVQADEAELMELLRESAVRPNSTEKADLLRALFRAWGSLNPTAALAYVAGMPASDRTKFEDEILKGWIRTDPLAAFAWAEAHDPGTGPLGGNRVNPRLPMVAHTLLELEQPNLVKQLLARVSGEKDRTAIAVELAEYLATYDLSAGIKWLREMPLSASRGSVASVLSHTIGRDDSPENAVAFALSLPGNGGGRNFAIGGVFSSLSESVPPANVAPLMSIVPEGLDRNIALTSFAPGFAARHPVDALGLLGLASDPRVREQLVNETSSSLLTRGMHREALDWASHGAGSAAVRTARLQRIALAWSQADPEGAETQIPSLNRLTDDERKKLLATVARTRELSARLANPLP